MAEKEIWFGSQGPFIFDDEDQYDDGVKFKGLRTTGGIMSADGIFFTLQVITVVNSPYTLDTEELVYADASDGDITINLPPSDVNTFHKLFYIQKTDFTQNVVIISPQSGELINDMPRLLLYKPEQNITLTTDNTGWRLV